MLRDKNRSFVISTKKQTYNGKIKLYFNLQQLVKHALSVNSIEKKIL